MAAPVNGKNVVAWALLAALGVCVGVSWVWGDLEVLLEQRRLWAEGLVVPVRGVEVEEAHESGEGLARFFRTYRYDVRVTYELDGTTLQAEATFSTLLRSIDQREPLELRVDRNDPSRFATSWAQERLGAMACLLVWKWSLTALWVVAMAFGVLLELRPEVVTRVEAVGEPRTPNVGSRVLGAAVLLLLTCVVLSLAGMFLEDLVRRVGSYLEELLGLMLGCALLWLGAAAWGLVSSALDRRRRSR